MNKYTFYWLDGLREVLDGDNSTDAFRRAGYGAGALRALDFTSNGDNNEYIWDKENNKWKRKWERK